MSYNETEAKKYGIVLDDMKKVRRYFNRHDLPKSEMIYRYNAVLNRWEVYSCPNFGTLRLIYTPTDWWEEPE